MKMKKFYQKALDEAFAAVQESSDVEFESDEDDDKGNKGKMMFVSWLEAWMKILTVIMR
jgi:hypothetical protein